MAPKSKMTSQTLLIIVALAVMGIAVVVYLLRDRLTWLSVSKEKVEIKAKETPNPAADLSVSGAKSGANLNVTENAGGTVEVRNTESAKDTTITRNPESASPPKS